VPDRGERCDGVKVGQVQTTYLQARTGLGTADRRGSPALWRRVPYEPDRSVSPGSTPTCRDHGLPAS